MAIHLKRAGDTLSVPSGTGFPASGTFVQRDGTAPSGGAQGINTVGVGFVVDDIPTTNPPQTRTAWGDGSIIEDDAASFSVDTELYSDGDGTISQTQPAGAAGTVIVSVGRAISTTEFVVNIQAIEKGA